MDSDCNDGANGFEAPNDSKRKGQRVDPDCKDGADEFEAPNDSKGEGQRVGPECRDGVDGVEAGNVSKSKGQGVVSKHLWRRQGSKARTQDECCGGEEEAEENQQACCWIEHKRVGKCSTGATTAHASSTTSMA